MTKDETQEQIIERVSASLRSQVFEQKLNYTIKIQAWESEPFGTTEPRRTEVELHFFPRTQRY
jgi:hypothetical protein